MVMDKAVLPTLLKGDTRSNWGKTPPLPRFPPLIVGPAAQQPVEFFKKNRPAVGRA
jgi:hypothetical protein